jgi:hypothetical protein
MAQMAGAAGGTDAADDELALLVQDSDAPYESLSVAQDDSDDPVAAAAMRRFRQSIHAAMAEYCLSPPHDPGECWLNLADDAAKRVSHLTVDEWVPKAVRWGIMWAWDHDSDRTRACLTAWLHHGLSTVHTIQMMMGGITQVAADIADIVLDTPLATKYLALLCTGLLACGESSTVGLTWTHVATVLQVLAPPWAAKVQVELWLALLKASGQVGVQAVFREHGARLGRPAGCDDARWHQLLTDKGLAFLLS